MTSINRHYYEMAVLTELRNYVRSGDVSIVGSRQHKDFDEYLVPKENWERIEPSTTKLAVSMSASDYLAERTESLLKRLEWVSKNVDDLEGVNVENGKLHIERLEKDTPEDARDFSVSLYELLPRIKLTDLLIEVANWTKFHEQFIQTSTNRTPNDEETKVLMATIMAMGTNIGLTKMAEATIQENYDDVLRVAHSIREGTVSASLIMGKLGSYARQNSLATALREMGRIEKTIFILDYLSSEALR